jgi:hypothetical protein
MLLKKLIAIILILLVPHSYINAQALTVTNTSNVILSGSIVLNFNNTNSITNNGVFNSLGSNSTVIYSCNCNAVLGGSASSSFNNFTFNVSPLLTLNGNIQVDGDLKFVINGLIELNNNDIDLGSGSGKIVGETNAARVTGINGGRILKTQDLNAPAGVNPGNLGLEISTTHNLGLTQIIRGHVQQYESGRPFSGVYRYFDFFPATGNTSGMNIGIRFNYFDDEVVPTYSKSDLSLWESPDGGTNWTYLNSDFSDVNNDWVQQDNISFINARVTLSPASPAPLPVKIISFAGRMVNNESLLNWNINNDGSLNYFELERSNDGASFTYLSSIVSSNATGNIQLYSYTDEHPFNPYTYYRLKLVDKTQKSFYSNVVKLKSGNEIIASLYPNPASDHSYLSFSSLTSGNTSVELFNAAGQMVRSENIAYNTGENVIEISLSNLPKGMYILRSAGINIEHNTLIKN